jgi:hypothetical protein
VVFAWVLLGQSLGVVQLLGAGLVLVGISLVRVEELRSPSAAVDVPPSEAAVLGAQPTDP